MSQKEQILQILSRALSTFGSLSTLTQNTTAQYIIKEQIQDLNRAIAHVKETPEYESAPLVRSMSEEKTKLAEAMKNPGVVDYMMVVERSKATIQSPLVRLTEEDQLKIVNFFLHCGLDNWQKLWQCSNAIMDVMEQKNRGAE